MESNELSNQINAQNFSLENASSIETQKEKFCQVWPPTRKGLELLKDLVKNPFVKLTIGGIISAGDAVYKMLGCTI